MPENFENSAVAAGLNNVSFHSNPKERQFPRMLALMWASLVALTVKNLPAMQETLVQSLSQEDPLEKEMATHSSIIIWRNPWTEKPERLQYLGSQRVGHD